MQDAKETGRESAERNIGYLMHDAARLLRVNYDRRMRDLELTRSQWWVLNHVYFNEGIIQTELSAILEIERARDLREQALSGLSEQDQERLIDMLIKMKKNLSPVIEAEEKR
jgi:DNA-binding MarR family transcriptional regulator